MPEEQADVWVDREALAGVWSNEVSVSSAPGEFMLDFFRKDLAAARSVLVARVAMSPGLFVQLMESLPDAWQLYADRSMPKEVRGDEDP